MKNLSQLYRNFNLPSIKNYLITLNNVFLGKQYTLSFITSSNILSLKDFPETKLDVNVIWQNGNTFV